MAHDKDNKSNGRQLINEKLVDTIHYRQKKRFIVTIFMLLLFLYLMGFMAASIMNGSDLLGGWKDILNIMLGAFLGSFSKVIDFWFDKNDKQDKHMVDAAND